jgi:hypothetical protein
MSILISCYGGASELFIPPVVDATDRLVMVAIKTEVHTATKRT